MSNIIKIYADGETKYLTYATRSCPELHIDNHYQFHIPDHSTHPKYPTLFTIDVKLTLKIIFYLYLRQIGEGCHYYVWTGLKDDLQSIKRQIPNIGWDVYHSVNDNDLIEMYENLECSDTVWKSIRDLDYNPETESIMITARDDVSYSFPHLAECSIEKIDNYSNSIC